MEIRFHNPVEGTEQDWYVNGSGDFRVVTNHRSELCIEFNYGDNCWDLIAYYRVDPEKWIVVANMKAYEEVHFLHQKR